MPSAELGRSEITHDCQVGDPMARLRLIELFFEAVHNRKQLERRVPAPRWAPEGDVVHYP